MGLPVCVSTSWVPSEAVAGAASASIPPADAPHTLQCAKGNEEPFAAVFSSSSARGGVPCPMIRAVRASRGGCATDWRSRYVDPASDLHARAGRVL